MKTGIWLALGAGAQTVASLERVKKIAPNMKATIIIQHDLRDIGKLPAFPAAAK